VCQCDGVSCNGGCCTAQTGVCVSSTTAQCGTTGAECVYCNTAYTNQCNSGSCGCGSGPACGAGLVCVSGTCTCTASSCPNGCCQGNVCYPGNTTALCGVGGAACQTCSSPGSDTCTSGYCVCGGQSGG